MAARWKSGRPPFVALVQPADLWSNDDSALFGSHHGALRQLDLRRRLLQYPCSYMIYSQQLDQLPTLTR
jgi:hypothetical protein